MTTLVVAAHPDDEVLGCGGTMARLADEGEELHVLILGEGETSRVGADPAAVGALIEASMAAAEVLGVKSVDHVGLPDNRFDHVDVLEVVQAVEAVIARIQPDVVFCQHGGDVNVDHRVTFQAVLAATRPVPGSGIRAVYAFEVPSSTEWSFQRLAPAFRPSVFFDISAALDRKLAALECYAREMRPFPHPRSAEAVTAYARRWGSAVGCAAAEAFDTVRDVR